MLSTLSLLVNNQLIGLLDCNSLDRAFIVAVRYLAAYPSKYAELRELNAEYERVVYGGLSDENKTEGGR